MPGLNNTQGDGSGMAMAMNVGLVAEPVWAKTEPTPSDVNFTIVSTLIFAA
jgi:hypothetical protein